MQRKEAAALAMALILIASSGAAADTNAEARPDVLEGINIPTVDISGETGRHVIVAEGAEETYQGHVDTLLMLDGETMFAAWSIGHAVHIGPLARSQDGGLTWETVDTPENWWDVSNTPTIHRLVDPDGTERLFVFGGGLRMVDPDGGPPYPMYQAVSEDGGATWSSMERNGLEGEVPPKSIKSFDDGQRLVMWSDMASVDGDPAHVWQSESTDGGLTWSEEAKIFETPARWAQPSVIRSPDGGQLLMLMRENSREHNSLYSTSDDDGQTWAEPRETPAALTGDRHVIRYAPDGRLVVVMRDRAGQGIDGWNSPTYGHYVAWVGAYDDIVEGREGQYRVKLLHSHAGPDCGYSGLELLPNGEFVATTYVKYRADDPNHSVVSTRFNLEELDAEADNG